MTRRPCTTSFRQGEVILTEVAFSGDAGRKRRLAFVISIDELNRVGTKLIVAAITSNVSPPFRRDPGRKEELP